MEQTINNRKLQIFLYILLRDHLPSGKVEEIMEKYVEGSEKFDGIKLTNRYTADHIIDIMNRMSN